MGLVASHTDLPMLQCDHRTIRVMPSLPVCRSRFSMLFWEALLLIPYNSRLYEGGKFVFKQVHRQRCQPS